MKTVFRSMVCVSTVAYALLFFLPAFSLSISQETALLRGHSGHGSIFAGFAWFPWIFLLAWLVIALGLFFFEAWARVGFIALYVVVLVLRLVQGTTVHLPIEGFLGEIVSLLDGAIIALAFTEPVATYFRRA